MEGNSKRPESAIQFEEIYEKWNDPDEKIKRRILKNREQRIENKKRDLGL